MNGKQLKNSILQWAIQGKLVPQDPNDEPASVLLERIREEKARLVKEGKIKKDKNESIIFRGDDNSHYEKFADGYVKCIDDEIPFEIPEGWEWERWGNISLSIQYGYNAPAIERGDIKMVRISDIHDNVVQWSTVPFCKIAPHEIDTYLLKENDILFARTGGTVGKSFLVQSVPEPAIYAGYLIRTRYSQELCPQYLKSFMESQLYWEQLKSGTIATAQPNCNGKTLGRMLLPIPPKAEQKRLIRKLENLSPLLLRYAKSQQELDELNDRINDRLMKSILQEAIQGKLVPQDPNDEPASVLLERIREKKQRLLKEGKLKKKDTTDSIIFKGEDNKYYEQIGKEVVDISEDIPFEIPESWSWSRLSMLVNMRIGKTPARGDSTFWDNGVHAWISISDLSQGDIIMTSKEKISDFAASSVMGVKSQAGSLLMSFKLTVGKTAILGIDAYHNEAIVTISTMCDENYYTRNYLAAILPLLTNYGDTKDAIKGKTLNSQSLNALLIPIPPHEEQRRIIENIQYLFSKLR